jgi:hypothetical protein
MDLLLKENEMEHHFKMTSDELINAAMRVIKMIDAEKEVAQLRDELAKATERAEAALSHSEFRVTNLIDRAEQLTKERDEALAKLQQPDRMIMNDGGKLWEVFRISQGSEHDESWEYYIQGREMWRTCGDNCLWQRDYLYRRPITPDQLREWLPRCDCGDGST